MTEHWSPAVSTCTCACPNHFSRPEFWTMVFFVVLLNPYSRTLKFRHSFTKKSFSFWGRGPPLGRPTGPLSHILNTPLTEADMLDVDERVKRTIMTSSSRAAVGNDWSVDSTRHVSCLITPSHAPANSLLHLITDHTPAASVSNPLLSHTCLRPSTHFHSLLIIIPLARAAAKL